MIIRELHQVPNHRIGRVNKNNVETKLHEDSTILFLTQFGFDIDIIKPRNVYKTKNADIFMNGAIWEIKSPITTNKTTLKTDFRKASSQADRVIFDLRRIRKDSDEAKKQIVELFKGRGRVRRLIVIEKSGRTLEYSKKK